jgi:hypothetical protein
MQARFNAYSTPAMQEFAGRPLRAEASAAERQAWQKAFDRVAEMDDEEDFPSAEYGPVALRFSYWNSGGIFPAWSPNASHISLQDTSIAFSAWLILSPFSTTDSG